MTGTERTMIDYDQRFQINSNKFKFIQIKSNKRAENMINYDG